MYSSLFCRLYNEFGWNEYPRTFAEELLTWLDARHIHIRTALDIGCGTGGLCEALSDHGIETLGIDLSAEMIAIAQERAPLLVLQGRGYGDLLDLRPLRPRHLHRGRAEPYYRCSRAS